MLRVWSFLFVFVPPEQEIKKRTREKIKKHFRLVFKDLLLIENSSGSFTNMEWVEIGLVYQSFKNPFAPPSFSLSPGNHTAQ